MMPSDTGTILDPSNYRPKSYINGLGGRRVGKRGLFPSKKGRKEVISMAVCPKTGKRGIPLWHLVVAFSIGIALGFIVNFPF